MLPTTPQILTTSNYKMSITLPIEILLQVAQYLDCNGQYTFLRACPFLAGDFSYSRHLSADTDSNGNNLVHILAQNGEEALLKSLFPDDDLERSCCVRNVIPRLKQMLLTRSINDDGATPIHLAAERGYLAIVEWIAKRPAVDLSYEDKAGATSVERAARAGHTEVVSLLLDNPNLTTDWNANQRSNPLCLAAEHGHTETVRVILERHGERVNVNSRAAYGITALSLAVLREREAITEMLLQQKDIDVSAEDYLGNSTLHMAVRSENHAALKLLLEHPDANPNLRDWYGHTPLQEAVCMGDVVTVKLLLKHPRTDVNLGNCKQVSPLIKAVQESREQIIQLLLKRPDIKADQKDYCGMTAFAWAAFLGRVEIAEILLQRPDVDPNSRDEDGVTPLSHSMYAGWEDVTEFLINRDDVDINAEDNFGWTALAHAKGAPDGISHLLMKMLLQHGATMELYPEMLVMFNSMTHSEIAIDMVASMIDENDLEAYMVKRFGQEKTDEALVDGENGVRTLLFRDTRAMRMRRDALEGIRYREPY
ncbi:ankyrin repeat-containing domain protein [Trichoderma evansii]